MHSDDSVDDALIFWRGSNCTCHFNFTEIQHFSVKKHLHALGHASNNDVLGFDSKLMYLSYDILAPIVLQCINRKQVCYSRLEIVEGYAYIQRKG